MKQHPLHRIEEPPPLPARTGIAGVHTLPRSPESVFVYWEIAPEAEARIATVLGARAVLLESTGEGGPEVVDDATPSVSGRYRKVQPGAAVRHTIAVLHPSGHLETLYTGPRVVAPGGHGEEADVYAAEAYGRRFAPHWDET